MTHCFSADQAAALTDVGFDLSPLRDDEPGALRAATELEDQLLRTCWTVQQVAQHLGYAPARVVRRLHNHTLCQWPGVRPPLLPSFQFTESGVVPCWGAVATKIPPGLHPLELSNFLHRHQPDLDDLTPLEWLLAGRAADQVVILMESLTDAM